MSNIQCVKACVELGNGWLTSALTSNLMVKFY